MYQIRKRGDERRKGRRKEEEEEGKGRPREEKVSDHSSEKGEAVSCLSAKLGMTSMLSRHCGVGKTSNLSFHNQCLLALWKRSTAPDLVDKIAIVNVQRFPASWGKWLTSMSQKQIRFNRVR